MTKYDYELTNYDVCTYGNERNIRDEEFIISTSATTDPEALKISLKADLKNGRSDMEGHDTNAIWKELNNQIHWGDIVADCAHELDAPEDADELTVFVFIRARPRHISLAESFYNGNWDHVRRELANDAPLTAAVMAELLTWHDGTTQARALAKVILAGE